MKDEGLLFLNLNVHLTDLQFNWISYKIMPSEIYLKLETIWKGKLLLFFAYN